MGKTTMNIEQMLFSIIIFSTQYTFLVMHFVCIIPEWEAVNSELGYAWLISFRFGFSKVSWLVKSGLLHPRKQKNKQSNENEL